MGVLKKLRKSGGFIHEDYLNKGFMRILIKEEDRNILMQDKAFEMQYKNTPREKNCLK